MGHVRALLAVGDPEEMELIAKQAIKEKMSVRAVELLVKKMHEPAKPQKEKNVTLVSMEERLQNKFQTRVSLNEKQIVIRYHGNDDLNRILEILDCLDE